MLDAWLMQAVYDNGFVKVFWLVGINKAEFLARKHSFMLAFIAANTLAIFVCPYVVS